MFAVEKYTVDKNAEDVAMEMIQAQGDYHKMGSGSYGAVYGSRNSNIVYKIGNARNNDGYLAFIKVLAKQKKHNPFLPKIYGVRFIEDQHGNEYFVVAMERLQELPNQLYDATNFLRVYIENNDDMSGAKDLGVEIKVPAALKQAIKVAETARKSAKYADWDLYACNFMVRDAKQIVMTDPLC